MISWTCLLLAPHEPVVVAACFAGLAMGLMLTALCVQHDANHGAYFRKQRNNHLLGWTGDALLGFSSYAWRFKHNVSHHTYTNVDGCDDDVSQVPLARFAPSQEPRPVVPVPAPLHLADVHPGGCPLADDRRSRFPHSRTIRADHHAFPAWMEPRRARHREGGVLQLGPSSSRSSSSRGGSSSPCTSAGR